MDIPEAIAAKRLLRFDYDGHVRVAEPHTYGIDTRSQRVLVAYQVGGGSRSGESVGWKTFREDEMRGIVALDDRFARPRDGYRRNDPAFVTIIAQL